MTIQATSPRLHGNRHLQETDDAALPIHGWHLRYRVQASGRAVIEITDDLGDLAALVASSTTPMLSVDAAWRGQGREADGGHRWWAVAVGHASISNEDGPVVTFTRRSAAHRRGYRSVVRPVQTRGLWIAAAPGLYTAVSCQQASRHTVRRLAPHPSGVGRGQQ